TDDRRALDLDYSDLEPLLVRPDGEVMPLRERFGTRVDSVRVGPEATHADLARLADSLRGGKSAGVEVSVAIGSRQVRELAIRSGALARLDAAGVQIESTRDRMRPARLGAGLALAYGEPGATASRMHRTGLDACAEAARTGAVADPRGLDVPRDFASEDEVWFAQTILRPSAAGLPALPRPNGLARARITG